jgi:hypothetical protein
MFTVLSSFFSFLPSSTTGKGNNTTQDHVGLGLGLQTTPPPPLSQTSKATFVEFCDELSTPPATDKKKKVGVGGIGLGLGIGLESEG